MGPPLLQFVDDFLFAGAELTGWSAVPADEISGEGEAGNGDHDDDNCRRENDLSGDQWRDDDNQQDLQR